MVDTTPAGPRWAQRPGVVLLPLRMFLGLTFLYAGASKLASPTYLDAASPLSVHAQMVFAQATSPIAPLVRLTAAHATSVGLLIAFGEIAAGLGTVLGLWARVAALGGVLLSASFFLTVSWSTWPYFYGADIVFLFAWTPFVVLGDGGVASLATSLRRAVRRSMDLAPVPAATEPAAVRAEVNRRTMLRTGAVAAAVGAVAVVTGGLTALVRHRSGPALAAPTPSPTPTPSQTTSPTPSSTPSATPSPTASATPSPTASASASPTAGVKGTAVVARAAVAVGGAAPFTDPATGQPAYAVQPQPGDYKAFSAVCTHQGCTVNFAGGEFACPCHGSTFDGSTGAVISGPAPTPLPAITVSVDGPNLVTP